MLVKKSLSISGHRTSLALESEFWAALNFAAAQEGKSLASVVAQIDKSRDDSAEKSGLASAVRVWLFHRYSTGIAPQGSARAEQHASWCDKCGAPLMDSVLQRSA